MKDQINTIREALNLATDGPIVDRDGTIAKALAALTQLEAMVGEQEPDVCGKCHGTGYYDEGHECDDGTMAGGNYVVCDKCAAPVAQQQQYDQTALELCAVCGWKTLIPGDCCLNCERNKAQQPQAERKPLFAEAIAKHPGLREELLEMDKQPQAEAVPLTHVLVPVDEPTDEMVDAACAAVDGLCRVDFVRAYVAAFAHLKAGYRDESYWCGWNAAIKFQQAEAVPVVDRVYEAAKRLVDHADFQLGGVLSAKSKARDIPSNAASKVKARHLASLRDALAKTPQQAEAVPKTGDCL